MLEAESKIIFGLSSGNPHSVRFGLSLIGLEHHNLTPYANSITFGQAFGSPSGQIMEISNDNYADVEVITEGEPIPFEAEGIGLLNLFSRPYLVYPRIPPYPYGTNAPNSTYYFSPKLSRNPIALDLRQNSLPKTLFSVFGSQAVTFIKIYPSNLEFYDEWIYKYPILGSGLFMSVIRRPLSKSDRLLGFLKNYLLS